MISFTGHFNSLPLNLNGRSEQQIFKKTLCFDQRRIPTNSPKNTSLVYFSNTNIERSLEVEASWDIKFVFSENKPMSLEMGPPESDEVKNMQLLVNSKQLRNQKPKLRRTKSFPNLLLLNKQME